MTTIRVTDETVIPFPQEAVWEVIAKVNDYPRWWPDSLEIKILKDTGEALGTEVEIKPHGSRPFCCRVNSVQPTHTLGAEYFGSLMEGKGGWRLEPAEGGTRVFYDIDVIAHGWLVDLMGKAIDFNHLHSRMMKDVFVCLEQELRKRHPAA